MRDLSPGEVQMHQLGVSGLRKLKSNVGPGQAATASLLPPLPTGMGKRKTVFPGVLGAPETNEGSLSESISTHKSPIVKTQGNLDLRWALASPQNAKHAKKQLDATNVATAVSRNAAGQTL